MGQLENGGDKDFVLSSSSPDSNALDPREDLYHGTGRNVSGERAFKHIYIAIGGFLILIVLSVVVIARTYSLAEKVQLLALESRLEQLESRLGSIEGEGGLSQTGGQGNQLILLTERLDQLEANMAARINAMANQLKAMPPKPVSEAAAKTDAVLKTEAAAPAPSPEKEIAAKIHTVKPGETLYRISRRYNLSVEQLRQYNELDSKASIYPGQKLKVSPPQ
jgi:LysM repeat protein